MPIYEYRCTSCGHELEALQKISDAPLTACPSCKSDGLVKRVSAAGFQLKGSGWYATDFKGGKPAAAKATGDSKGPDGKTETKSDTKSETKSETKTDSTPSAGGCGAGCSCH
ncbi:MAG: FmdB family zinc ribbon protein [Gemmatimonas sp.]|jgi:putative FmdB family regulatory protein